MNNPTQNLLARLEGVRPVGDKQHEARCPSHEDRTASLSVTTAPDGKVLLHCHAGCTPQAIVAAAGLEMKDLFMPNENGHAGNGKATAKPAAKGKAKSAKPLGTFVCAYDYKDEQGQLLFQVCRFKDPKDFRQRRPDGNGNFTWKVKGTRSVLYRLPELLAVPDDVVFLCEGEKDADAIVKAGMCATSAPMGAGKFDKVADHARSVLRDANVIVVLDQDDAGRAHARQVAEILKGYAASITVVKPTGAFKDVADHLGAGHDLEHLEIVEVTEDASDQDSNAVALFDETFLPLDLAPIVAGEAMFMEAHRATVRTGRHGAKGLMAYVASAPLPNLLISRNGIPLEVMAERFPELGLERQMKPGAPVRPWGIRS